MSWLELLHPSTQRLRTWLLTGEPDGVGVHVESCERCAGRLEELDFGEPVLSLDAATSFRQALASALAPPEGLNERVLHRVAARSGLDREMTLFAGLFAIGVETAQLMIGPDPGVEPRLAQPGHRRVIGRTEEDDE